jgi:hypothetical protein
MFQVDRDFLVFQVRRLSMGDDVMTDWKCSKCGVENQDQVDLSKLPVVEWPDDKPLSFPFELPKGLMLGDKLVRRGTAKVLTGEDAEKVAASVAKAPETAGTAFLSALIESWEGGAKPDVTTLRRMRTVDRNAIARVVRDVSPGVRMAQDFTCASCGHLNEGVQVDASDFFADTSPT